MRKQGSLLKNPFTTDVLTLKRIVYNKAYDLLIQISSESAKNLLIINPEDILKLITYF